MSVEVDELKTDAEEERSEKKPGMLRRLFGKKKQIEEAEADAESVGEETVAAKPEEPETSGEQVGETEPVGEEPQKETELVAEELPVEEVEHVAEEEELPETADIGEYESEKGAEDDGEPSGVEPKVSVFGRLKAGLSRTRTGLVTKVDRILLGKKEVDEETFEELEEALVTADVGVNTSIRLIEEIQEKVSRRELISPEALRDSLKEAIHAVLKEEEGHFDLAEDKPHVVMVVGVNGVGKTTTIGKLASQFAMRDKKVVLAAADTFRAAAIEQLSIWGERTGAHVVRHQHGADSAAVAYDAVESAKARGADIVLVDTAGRLHTKSNLMEELKKVKRVIGKSIPDAPHEVLMVLDATTGQNGISQAKVFRDQVGVDAVALTKLDGTAKGGVIIALSDELGLPIKFIGIGEKVEDLRPFDARSFVDALF